MNERYATIELPEQRRRSDLGRVVSLGGTYRFEVQAVDRAGEDRPGLQPRDSRRVAAVANPDR